MVKRTPKEIEADLKRIKEASKTAASIAELSIATGLSYSMVNTTLSKHPIISKRIKAKLTENAELEFQKKEVEKQTKLELLKKEAEERTKLKSQKREATKNLVITTETPNKTAKSFTGYVIDASITGFKNLKEILSKICLTEEKIILTSITIKELEKLQTLKDKVKSRDARYILALAAENPKNFESVLIDETLDTPDNCIVKYCADNAEKVTLLTADKTMALNARMYGVKAEYFKHTYNSSSNTNQPTNSRIRTLIPARRIGSQLLVSNFHTNNLSICIRSNGKEYNDGIRELHVGDDVFISSKKVDYITFAHYKMISTYAEDNCELVFSKRFYDYNDLDVPNQDYKLFLEDFKIKHNL